MIAPVSERLNVNELKGLMGKFENYFVIRSDIQEFAAQLLEHKNARNPINLERNHNKLTF